MVTTSSGGGGMTFEGYGSGTAPLPDVGGGGAGAYARRAIEESRREREARERAAGPQRLTSDDGMTAEGQAMHGILTTTTPIYDEDDDGPCARGWVQYQAAQERYASEAGDERRHGPGDAMTRRVFIQQCEALPAEQRECVDSEYRQQHVADCEEFTHAQTATGERMQRGVRRHDHSTIQIPSEGSSSSRRRRETTD